ncbi:MAG: ribose 5-phosphate isomerase B [Bacilli bacterium]|nr:ribose 5-phosphate isomerase B [Bacilli bacterium]
MRISIGSDHGGLNLKEKIKETFKEIEFVDRGTYSFDSCDYPIFAKAVAQDVRDGNADFGILVCTNGVGMSITANKIKGVRAALCLSTDMAMHARRHNGANVLCLGEINQPMDEALKIVKEFITTPMADEERHLRRINLIKEIEEEK